mmetsp:Transcript_10972/g.31713  ORF Transcript_10972/g.31713 Transcript_10972/m.31713 type:complete len:221 (-) Transcript_10972:257-919(-)
MYRSRACGGSPRAQPPHGRDQTTHPPGMASQPTKLTSSRPRALASRACARPRGPVAGADSLVQPQARLPELQPRLVRHRTVHLRERARHLLEKGAGALERRRQRPTEHSTGKRDARQPNGVVGDAERQCRLADVVGKVARCRGELDVCAALAAATGSAVALAHGEREVARDRSVRVARHGRLGFKHHRLEEDLLARIHVLSAVRIGLVAEVLPQLRHGAF